MSALLYFQVEFSKKYFNKTFHWYIISLLTKMTKALILINFLGFRHFTQLLILQHILYISQGLLLEIIISRIYTQCLIRFGRRLSYSVVILFGGVCCFLALAVPRFDQIHFFSLLHLKCRNMCHSEDSPQIWDTESMNLRFIIYSVTYNFSQLRTCYLKTS